MSLIKGIACTESQGRVGLLKGLIVKKIVYWLKGPVLAILRISILLHLLKQANLSKVFGDD